MAFDGKKIAENLFFSVACISCFTCIIRSDYNFAVGLLCYYMIKNAQPSKMQKTTMTVSTKFRWLLCPALTKLWLKIWDPTLNLNQPIRFKCKVTQIITHVYLKTRFLILFLAYAPQCANYSDGHSLDSCNEVRLVWQTSQECWELEIL